MAHDEDSAQDPPAFDSLAGSIVAKTITPAVLSSFQVTITNAIVEAIKTVVAGAINIGAGVIEPIARGIAQGEELAGPAFERLNRLAIEDLLGVSIPPGTLAGRGAGRRVAEDAAIGDAILRAFANHSGPIVPSADPAKRFLSTMVGFSIEGWLEGWITELLGNLVSLGQVDIEKFADLDDILANTLGLGRLSRRIMGPYIDALITTPLEWHVNKVYRPALLTASQLARELGRGRMTREQVYEELARQGYDDTRIEALLSDARRKPSVSDLMFLSREAGLPADTFRGFLRDLGYDADATSLLEQIELTKRYRTILDQSASEAARAYVEGAIDRADLLAILSETHQDPRERELFLRLVDLKRQTASRELTRTDAENAVRRGIWSMIDYRRYLERQGYRSDDITTLELLLRDVLNDRDVAAAARASLEAEKASAAAAKLLTEKARARELETRAKFTAPALGDLRRAALLGLMPVSAFADALRGRNYAPADIELLTRLLEADIDTRAAAEQVRRDRALDADDRSLTLAQLDRALELELLTIAEYEIRLRELGYSDDDRRVLAELARRRLEDRAAAAELRQGAAAALEARGISLAAAERAVKAGVLTLEEYAAELTRQGLNAGAVEILAATLAAELETAAAAARRRAEVAGELEPRGISLGAVEQAILLGVRPFEEYRRVLQEHRYSLVDQRLLEDLLAARLVRVSGARQARQANPAAAGEARLTLAQIERAVKAGVVPLETYRREIAAAGYDDAGARALEELLLLELGEARADEAVRGAVLEQFDGAGVGLEALERQFLAGELAAIGFRAALLAAGVDAADAERLTMRITRLRLLQTDGADLETAIAGELGRRELSLGQWKAAVLSGLRELREYRAFLESEGFAGADADVLTVLLELELENKAAAAGRGANGAGI